MTVPLETLMVQTVDQVEVLQSLPPDGSFVPAVDVVGGEMSMSTVDADTVRRLRAVSTLCARGLIFRTVCPDRLRLTTEGVSAREHSDPSLVQHLTLAQAVEIIHRAPQFPAADSDPWADACYDAGYDHGHAAGQEVALAWVSEVLGRVAVPCSPLPSR